MPIDDLLEPERLWSGEEVIASRPSAGRRTRAVAGTARAQRADNGMLRLHPLRAEAPSPPRGRISPERVEWARYVDRILLEHGAVRGTKIYEEKHLARAPARSLMAALTELGLHDRSELQGHTDRVKTGWVWTVEYFPRGARVPSRRG
jgi:hypothetical protein